MFGVQKQMLGVTFQYSFNYNQTIKRHNPKQTEEINVAPEEGIAPKASKRITID